MHEDIKSELVHWYSINKSRLDTKKIGELGSFNINGSVKDIIPSVVGFDILSGKSVDVVLIPGIIPDEHRNIYGFIISTGSFQCCPDSKMFKTEILDLLEVGGELFLTMCSDECKYQHSTSPNSYKFKDGVRMNQTQLVEFLSPEIQKIDVKTIKTDIFYWGRKL